MRALERDPARRFQTAREMALALEAAVPMASPTRISAWVGDLASDVLASRARTVVEIESQSGVGSTLGASPAGTEEETRTDPQKSSRSLPEVTGTFSGSQAAVDGRRSHLSEVRGAKWTRSLAAGLLVLLAVVGVVGARSRLARTSPEPYGSAASSRATTLLDLPLPETSVPE